MKVEPTALAGAFVLEVDRHVDERGHFARTYCEDELGAHGIETHWPQMNLSSNRRRGLIRGMHFQISPHAEAKIVRCVKGAIFDVMIDIRPGSPTRLRWVGVELTASNARAVYIPAGFAHGFQVLEDESDVLYMMSLPHAPEAARGFRWNDESVSVSWPIAEPSLGARDADLGTAHDVLGSPPR